MIKAIETRYAGCRFRSRLEARWAVFFDAAGIRWEYEPEGLHVEWRLRWDGETFQYLPDFWLPDLNLWAEVKGSLTEAEGEKLLNAAAFLSLNGASGGCADSLERGSTDLVLLGPIPRKGVPWRLHMHDGELLARPWMPGRDEHRHFWKVALDGGSDFSSITCYSELGHGEVLLRRLLLGDTHFTEDWYPAAIKAARSARFEFLTG